MGDNNYKNLRNTNDILKQSRTDWSEYSQKSNTVNNIDEFKKLNNEYLSKSGENYGDIMDNLNDTVNSNLEIQRDATAMSKNSLNYLNSGNSFLSDLNDELGSDVNELRIERDNKKRLIEMQRNRLYKYEFIKSILLYVIGIIIFISMILLVEKIFMKKKTVISSGLIILFVSLFCIFLLFKVIDYKNRSKFNFREYNIDGGNNKYKKSVAQYDKDMIEGGLYSANDQLNSVKNNLADYIHSQNNGKSKDNSSIF